MSREKFPTLSETTDTFNLWSRKLDYIQDYLERLAKSGETYVTSSTASASLSLNGGLIICDSTANFALNLPTGKNRIGLTYSITNINTGTVTLTPASTNEKIHSDVTFDLFRDENLQITSNGTNWYVS